MATRKKATSTATKEATSTATKEVKKLDKVTATQITDIKERWSDGDSVLFDCVINNAIQLYSLTGKFDKDDKFWVSFPARKGSDGKYYKYLYVDFADDALEKLENTLFSDAEV